MTIEYTDKFTLDGRLKPAPGVTKAKTLKVKQLLEAGRKGDRVAAAYLSEAISSSDALLNAVHLVNLQVLPQFDDTERTWAKVASVRTVPDFKPVVLQGLFGEWQGLARDNTATGIGPDNPAGIAPVVPEGSQYPYATIGNSEAAYGSIKKRGFAVGWTWEARINDAVGFFDQIPSQMIRAALDTEEYEVYSALVNGTPAGSQLAGGTTYTGATVAINAPISRNALVQAIFELSQRQINGRKIQVKGGYRLVVPLGTAPAVAFALNRDIISITDGTFTLSSDFLQDGVKNTEIVESEYVTGTNWYLLPAPGDVSRPALELGRLKGYEQPELRVENLQGSYIGAGAVSPFQGSFSNDTIDLRLRYPLGGLLWDYRLVVWSKGTSAA
jgi:hypothetical protein